MLFSAVYAGVYRLLQYVDAVQAQRMERHCIT